MPLNKKNSRKALGENPLSQGIFSQTEPIEESRILNQDSSYLTPTEKEKVNLRLPIELNDWLDDLLKQGKRKHGAKIAKEVWVQAALELLRAMPVDWKEIDSIETLQQTLEHLESKIKT